MHRVDPVGRRCHLKERALGHLGVDHARRDRIDTHAAVGVFDRRGARETDHAVFAGVVGGAHAAARQTRDRRHIDDRAACRNDVRQLVFEAQEHALEVDRDHRVPAVFSVSVDRHEHVALDAGVIDGEVERAEMPHGLCDHGLHVCAARDVGRHRQRGATGGLDQARRFSGCVLAAVGHHHPGSLGGERQRHRAADACASAGDEGDFALKLCGTAQGRHRIGSVN